MSLSHDSANNIIPTKTICRHSKGWWNPELTRLSKEYKKAKRQFAKRADGANESKMKSALNNFKEEEIKARHHHLEEMVRLMGPHKPDQFRKIVNSERKGSSKTAVQPICRDDGSLAVSVEDIFTEMKKR